MEDKNLTLEQEAQIKEKAAALKAEKKTRKVYPMVVFGDTDCGEKEFYVAYMGEPTFPQFSKFMAASKKDEVNAMRLLARDCFLDGDKELVDNESLFLFGLMSAALGDYHHPPESAGKLIDTWAVRDDQRIRQRLIYIRHYFPGVNLDRITDEEFAMLSEEALWLHQQVLVSRLTLQPPSP